MRTSAVIACILLSFSLYGQLTDSIRLVTLEALQQAEDAPSYTSSMLTAARDPVINAVAYNFSAMRFRQRGYNNDMFETGMNGVPMQNLVNGNTFWSSWSGLNEVLRNREQTAGLRNSSLAFAPPGGYTNIDVRAGRQRRQVATGYSIANRQYRHRFYYTYATGYNSNGWALAIELGRRWAAQGYAPGTDYNSTSYYVAVDKKSGLHHLFSIVLLGAVTNAARQAPVLQQTVQLTGNRYYNAYWGFQEGRKRNSSYNKGHQPQLMVTYDFHPDNKTSLVTTIGYSTGSNSVTGLDWYQAADPRPDYYRYLPDYYGNAAQRQQLVQAWATDANVSQINWERLYQVNTGNYTTVNNADGIAGNHVAGLRSLYIVQERITATRYLAVNSVLNMHPFGHTAVTAAFTYQRQQSRYYKHLNDLLGGDWFVDWNQFAERDYPNNTNAMQNDLNHPDRLVRKGDVFGYDYTLHLQKATAVIQMVYSLPAVDLFIAATASSMQYYREGHMRNGLFPENSMGLSAVNTFTGYGMKGGVTYKFNGRHYAYLNGAVISRPPWAANAYISPRTRQATQEYLPAEIIQSAEAGYVLNAPRLNVRAGGYITKFSNGIKMHSFYHDAYNNFVNYAISNINKWHGGVELSVDAKLTTDLSFNAVAAMGRYYYNSRQYAMVTADNTNEVLEKTTVYSNNYRLGTTPQEAYSAGISYRSPDAWFVSATGNYSRQQWLEVNPIRLTSQATDNVDAGSAQFRDIIQQVQWPSQFMLNLFAGYSWKLPASWHANTWLVLYAGVNNIMNNTGIIAGSYEQLRFDFEAKNRNTYPPRVWYAPGTNYFISINIRRQ